MSRSIDDINKERTEWERRLQILREKKATLGISRVDPSIDLEIENIENKLAELKNESQQESEGAEDGEEPKTPQSLLIIKKQELEKARDGYDMASELAEEKKQKTDRLRDEYKKWLDSREFFIEHRDRLNTELRERRKEIREIEKELKEAKELFQSTEETH